jgi:hypothetical protein
MYNPRMQRRLSFLAAGCYLALLLTAGVFAVHSLRLVEGGAWQIPASLFGLSAVVGLVCDWRVRATQRLHAVLDIYAERELARDMRRRAAVRTLD